MEQASTRTSADLSAIECLPDELLCAIIHCAPEAVHSIRLTSRVFRHAAEVYIGQVCDLVHKMEISLAGNAKACFQELRILMHVLPHQADLFELRLNHELSPLERARIRRDAPNGISSILVHRLQYNVNEGPEKLSSLRRCLGKVDTVSLINCMNENTMPSLHALLRVGIRIDTLILDTENMTEIVAANILEIMDAVQINDIRISVGDTSTDPGETVLPKQHRLILPHKLLITELPFHEQFKLLISLASRVHTLAINQLPVHGVNRDARFFLGEHFCNWNHTFVSMLGHARRLDKLCIDNIAYPRYLWSARTLAKELPEIGKEIWFETNSDATDVSTTRRNEHYVNVGARFLSIKHASRVNEPLDDKNRLKIKRQGGYSFIY